jgi:hypothetical protein
MIIVRVELHSAVTGKITELARMGIANTGGTARRGNYSVATYRGRSAGVLARRNVQRSGKVLNYPRLAVHIWHLVTLALIAMNYAGADQAIQPLDDLDGEIDLFKPAPIEARS